MSETVSAAPAAAPETAPSPASAPAPAAAPAPVLLVTPDAPAEAGYEETVQIGTISADSSLDPLSIVLPGGSPLGTLSINASGEILYTAPAAVTAGEIDSFTYEVEDSAGALSAPISASIALDPGPTATDPNLVVGHAGMLDLSTILSELATPGLAGDTLTLTAASAELGSIFQNKNGDFVYEPVVNGNDGSPTTVGYDLDGSLTGATGSSSSPIKSGNDVITYTVTDQLGDVVTGTADVTVDPGPTIAAGHTFVAAGTTVNLASYIESLITPGLKGDTETITAISAQSGTVTAIDRYDIGSIGPSGAPVSGNSTFGDLTVDYTAPASGNDSLTYTVTDENGDTATGIVTIQTDPGPILAPGSDTIGHGQPVNLTSYLESLITPGEPGDSETITWVQAEFGTVERYTLASYDGAGKEEILYTAPAGGDDTVTYTVTDQNGDTATGTVAITVDPGPILTPGSVVVGHGQTVNLESYIESLITPGLPGDSDIITSISTESGKVIWTHSSGAVGSEATIDYTAPASGSDTLSYTVVDQYGDQAAGTVAITVDPGPTLTQGAYTVGHGQSVNLTSYLEGLIQPGEAGDTETITAVKAANGTASYAAFAYSKGGPEQVSVGYTAPASGTDTLTYTVMDQAGDTATGTVAITVDPGPVAGNVTADVQVGGTIDLTQQILGADQPGLAGDTLTLVADDTQGTMGSVSLVDGDVVYTASNAAFAQLAGGATATDSFSYTVADQYGDQATGTVTLDVSNPVTTINGGPYGNAVIEGTGGNQIINAYDYGNTIYANGGNDVINAGQGQATVYAGSGNVTANLNGYDNVVTGGDGADSVSGSQGSTSVTLGNGNDTVNLAGYGNNITVGNGNDTIVAGAGSDTVAGGSGTDSVTLAGYSDSVSFTGGNDTISGGAGSDIFDLTGGSASVALNGYTNMVFLNDTNATIIDSGQGTSIDISAGGTDVIQGVASDQSLLVDLKAGLGGYTSAASAVAALTSDGNGGALLSFGASHGSLDFAGVAPGALHASNFQIG